MTSFIGTRRRDVAEPGEGVRGAAGADEEEAQGRVLAGGHRPRGRRDAQPDLLSELDDHVLLHKP